MADQEIWTTDESGMRKIKDHITRLESQIQNLQKRRPENLLSGESPELYTGITTVNADNPDYPASTANTFIVKLTDVCFAEMVGSNDHDIKASSQYVKARTQNGSFVAQDTPVRLERRVSRKGIRWWIVTNPGDKLACFSRDLTASPGDKFYAYPDEFDNYGNYAFPAYLLPGISYTVPAINASPSSATVGDFGEKIVVYNLTRHWIPSTKVLPVWLINGQYYTWYKRRYHENGIGVSGSSTGSVDLGGGTLTDIFGANDGDMPIRIVGGKYVVQRSGRYCADLTYLTTHSASPYTRGMQITSLNAGGGVHTVDNIQHFQEAWPQTFSGTVTRSTSAAYHYNLDAGTQLAINVLGTNITAWSARIYFRELDVSDQ